MWWVASLIFLIIVFMLLLQRLNNAEGYGGDALKGLTWLTILVWLVYPIVWIVGSEGTGALGLSQEVGIITIADLIAKIGFRLLPARQRRRPRGRVCAPQPVV